MHTGGGLAIWRGDEYILSFLFAIRLQFQPTNNTRQLNNELYAAVGLVCSQAGSQETNSTTV
jgi:hypothetical protein